MLTLWGRLLRFQGAPVSHGLVVAAMVATGGANSCPLTAALNRQLDDGPAQAGPPSWPPAQPRAPGERTRRQVRALLLGGACEPGRAAERPPQRSERIGGKRRELLIELGLAAALRPGGREPEQLADALEVHANSTGRSPPKLVAQARVQQQAAGCAWRPAPPCPTWKRAPGWLLYEHRI